MNEQQTIRTEHWKLSFYPKLYRGKDYIHLEYKNGEFKVWSIDEFMNHIRELPGKNEQ